ncbi:MAG: hypothetical protein R3D33_12795 [Hyphomicrobiaceae bacterium]
MQKRLSLTASFVVVGALLGGLVLLASTAALAGYGAADIPRPLSVSRSKAEADAYLIDFIARDAFPFGHSYVRMSRMLAGGRVETVSVFGLYPDVSSMDEAMLAFLGAPAKVGFIPADLGQPLRRVRFKVPRARFEHVLGVVATLSHRPMTYQTFSENCNALVGRTAVAAGLVAPSETAVLPVDYIERLGRLNGQNGLISAFVDGTTGRAGRRAAVRMRIKSPGRHQAKRFGFSRAGQ